MSSDHEAEIRASVAAHQDLGSGYDDAVAEGLVERIGAEIDKRIDARLGAFGPGAPAIRRPQRLRAIGRPGTTHLRRPGRGPRPGRGLRVRAGPGYPGYQAPAGYQGYPGYQGYLGPMLPPGYQMGPPPAKPASVGQRNVATTSPPSGRWPSASGHGDRVARQ